jgi:hypothetical protein
LSALWAAIGLGVTGYGDIGAWCWFTSDEVRLLVRVFSSDSEACTRFSSADDRSTSSHDVSYASTGSPSSNTGDIGTPLTLPRGHHRCDGSHVRKTVPTSISCPPQLGVEHSKRFGLAPA